MDSLTQQDTAIIDENTLLASSLFNHQ